MTSGQGSPRTTDAATILARVSQDLALPCGETDDEIRVDTHDAAERVAVGLLRAAEVIQRCADRCEEWQADKAWEGRQDILRRRAVAYAQAARTYRQTAALYRDIGRQFP